MLQQPGPSAVITTAGDVTQLIGQDPQAAIVSHQLGANSRTQDDLSPFNTPARLDLLLLIAGENGMCLETKAPADG